MSGYSPLPITPIQQVYHQLDSQVALLTQQYVQHMQCKAGCSGCCLEGFRIRFAEAVMLFAAIAEGQLAQEKLHGVVSGQANKGGPCPLLDAEGRCQVYANRPALCRAFGVLVKMDNEVATCDLNFNELAPDALNATGAQGQMAVLHLNPFYEVLDELSLAYWQAFRQGYESDIAEDWPEAPPQWPIRQWLSWWHQQMG